MIKILWDISLFVEADEEDIWKNKREKAKLERFCLDFGITFSPCFCDSTKVQNQISTSEEIIKGDWKWNLKGGRGFGYQWGLQVLACLIIPTVIRFAVESTCIRRVLVKIQIIFSGILHLNFTKVLHRLVLFAISVKILNRTMCCAWQRSYFCAVLSNGIWLLAIYEIAYH